jgi:dihydroorotate dehydrogenase
MLYRHALRPLLFTVGHDAEGIHDRVLGMLAAISRSRALTDALRRACSLVEPGASSPQLARELFGLRFPNPIGLAAGFDKNAVALPALAALGFGFLEAGTVTRSPQPGNARPRLYRLPEAEALLNRMGFNNAGAAAVAEQLTRMQRANPLPVPLGISIGKSKVTPLEEATADYLATLDALYPYGDYFAVNISSPNTPGLRALQERDRLDELLAALVARLRETAMREGSAQPKPLLVKVAPDLDEVALDDVVGVCLARGASGLIAVNTTLDRSALPVSLRTAFRKESGGLSGRPLLDRALAVVKHLHDRAGDRLPIVGCGGIFTADDAQRMLDAGASLLQVYTGFIYEGPLIARRLAAGLAQSTAPTQGQGAPATRPS